MNDACPAVELRSVVRTFPPGRHASVAVPALRGIDLTIRPGEFVAVMGPSGSGKSTLLHLIAGLDQPTSGEVFVAGERLASVDEDAITLLRRRRLGMIFQAVNLLDGFSAAENVALPLVLDGVATRQARQRACAVLDQVGLSGRFDHLPGQLSGGEQQRVAIARALVVEPVIVLADEPTGNLDTLAGDQILDLLQQLVEVRQQTLLLVTHDPRHAARAGRLLNLRDGKIVADFALARTRSPSEGTGNLFEDA